MPDDKTWNNLFNIDLVLAELLINTEIIDLVEIGFGYGALTIPSSIKKGKI